MPGPGGGKEIKIGFSSTGIGPVKLEIETLISTVGILAKALSDAEGSLGRLTGGGKTGGGGALNVTGMGGGPGGSNEPQKVPQQQAASLPQIQQQAITGTLSSLAQTKGIFASLAKMSTDSLRAMSAGLKSEVDIQIKDLERLRGEHETLSNEMKGKGGGTRAQMGQLAVLQTEIAGGEINLEQGRKVLGGVEAVRRGPTNEDRMGMLKGGVSKVLQGDLGGMGEIVGSMAGREGFTKAMAGGGGLGAFGMAAGGIAVGAVIGGAIANTIIATSAATSQRHAAGMDKQTWDLVNTSLMQYGQGKAIQAYGGSMLPAYERIQATKNMLIQAEQAKIPQYLKNLDEIEIAKQAGGVSSSAEAALVMGGRALGIDMGKLDSEVERTKIRAQLHLRTATSAEDVEKSEAIKMHYARQFEQEIPGMIGGLKSLHRSDWKGLMSTQARLAEQGFSLGDLAGAHGALLGTGGMAVARKFENAVMWASQGGMGNAAQIAAASAIYGQPGIIRDENAGWKRGKGFYTPSIWEAVSGSGLDVGAANILGGIVAGGVSSGASPTSGLGAFGAMQAYIADSSNAFEQMRRANAMKESEAIWAGLASGKADPLQRGMNVLRAANAATGQSPLTIDYLSQLNPTQLADIAAGQPLPNSLVKRFSSPEAAQEAATKYTQGFFADLFGPRTIGLENYTDSISRFSQQFRKVGYDPGALLAAQKAELVGTGLKGAALETAIQKKIQEDIELGGILYQSISPQDITDLGAEAFMARIFGAGAGPRKLGRGYGTGIKKGTVLEKAARAQAEAIRFKKGKYEEAEGDVGKAYKMAPETGKMYEALDTTMEGLRKTTGDASDAVARFTQVLNMSTAAFHPQDKDLRQMVLSEAIRNKKNFAFAMRMSSPEQKKELLAYAKKYNKNYGSGENYSVIGQGVAK